MNKKPKIYKPDMSFTDNNRKAYYSYLDNQDKDYASDGMSIDSFLNKVSNDGNYVFNRRVIIITNNREYDTKIVGKFGNKIITIDNDSIDVNSILKVYEKKIK